MPVKHFRLRKLELVRPGFSPVVAAAALCVPAAESCGDWAELMRDTILLKVLGVPVPDTTV